MRIFVLTATYELRGSRKSHFVTTLSMRQEQKLQGSNSLGLVTHKLGHFYRIFTMIISHTVLNWVLKIPTTLQRLSRSFFYVLQIICAYLLRTPLVLDSQINIIGSKQAEHPRFGKQIDLFHVILYTTLHSPLRSRIYKQNVDRFRR